MLKPTVSMLVVIALLPTVRLQSASGQETPAPRTPSEFTEALVDAARAMDADSVRALSAEDVVMMLPDGQMVEGREEFHAHWSRRYAEYEERYGANPLRVVVDGVREVGDLAVARGQYGPEGAEPVGQFMWTLERDQNGGWLVDWWILNQKRE